jgi:hypothetical protein
MPSPFIPVTERLWQRVRNEAVVAAGSAAATTRALFLLLNARVTGFELNPFAILGSSDSITAGLDRVNRLTAPSKIVFAASGVHSWVIWSQAATGMQLCWDWNSTTAARATLVASLAGFTGGSTTARPTAVDERILISANAWTCGDDVQQVLHVFHSVDGLQTIILVCQGGDAKTMIVLGRAAEPVSGWTTPYFAFAAANSNGGAGEHATEWERLYRTPGMASWGPTGAMDLFASTHTTRAGGANASTPSCVQIDAADPLTGKFPTQPMGLVSVTTNMKGRHGRLADLWFVAPSLANGFFPGTDQYAVFGEYMISWGGGAAPQLA